MKASTSRSKPSGSRRPGDFGGGRVVRQHNSPQSDDGALPIRSAQSAYLRDGPVNDCNKPGPCRCHSLRTTAAITNTALLNASGCTRDDGGQLKPHWGRQTRRFACARAIASKQAGDSFAGDTGPGSVAANDPGTEYHLPFLCTARPVEQHGTF